MSFIHNKYSKFNKAIAILAITSSALLQIPAPLFSEVPQETRIEETRPEINPLAPSKGSVSDLRATHQYVETTADFLAKSPLQAVQNKEASSLASKNMDVQVKPETLKSRAADLKPLETSKIELENLPISFNKPILTTNTPTVTPTIQLVQNPPLVLAPLPAPHPIEVPNQNRGVTITVTFTPEPRSSVPQVITTHTLQINDGLTVEYLDNNSYRVKEGKVVHESDKEGFVVLNDGSRVKIEFQSDSTQPNYGSVKSLTTSGFTAYFEIGVNSHLRANKIISSDSSDPKDNYEYVIDYKNRSIVQTSFYSTRARYFVQDLEESFWLIVKYGASYNPSNYTVQLLEIPGPQVSFNYFDGKLTEIRQYVGTGENPSGVSGFSSVLFYSVLQIGALDIQESDLKSFESRTFEGLRSLLKDDYLVRARQDVIGDRQAFRLYHQNLSGLHFDYAFFMCSISNGCYGRPDVYKQVSTVIDDQGNITLTAPQTDGTNKIYEVKIDKEGLVSLTLTPQVIATHTLQINDGLTVEYLGNNTYRVKEGSVVHESDKEGFVVLNDGTQIRIYFLGKGEVSIPELGFIKFIEVFNSKNNLRDIAFFESAKSKNGSNLLRVKQITTVSGNIIVRKKVLDYGQGSIIDEGDDAFGHFRSIQLFKTAEGMEKRISISQGTIQIFHNNFEDFFINMTSVGGITKSIWHHDGKEFYGVLQIGTLDLSERALRDIPLEKRTPEALRYLLQNDLLIRKGQTIQANDGTKFELFDVNLNHVAFYISSSNKEFLTETNVDGVITLTIPESKGGKQVYQVEVNQGGVLSLFLIHRVFVTEKFAPNGQLIERRIKEIEIDRKAGTKTVLVTIESYAKNGKLITRNSYVSIFKGNQTVETVNTVESYGANGFLKTKTVDAKVTHGKGAPYLYSTEETYNTRGLLISKSAVLLKDGIKYVIVYTVTRGSIMVTRVLRGRVEMPRLGGKGEINPQAIAAKLAGTP